MYLHVYIYSDIYLCIISKGWGYPTDSQEYYGSAKANDETVERILKMEPKVECTRESMKLNVQDSTQGTLLFVDRGKYYDLPGIIQLLLLLFLTRASHSNCSKGSRLSPLPLSKLPSSCGYTMKSTRKDLVLAAPYDGCFVAVEVGCFITFNYLLLLHLNTATF